MAECTRCGREHAVPRKFHTGELAASREAALYVATPEAWPAFLAHLRSECAHLLGDMTDEQLLAAHKNSAQLLADLVNQSAPEFIVLRNIRVQAVPMTAVAGDEPPGILTLGLPFDDGGMTAISWLVRRGDAEALAAAWREQVGEPDTEAVMDCAGGVRLEEAVASNMTVMTRECEHGEP